MKLRGMPVDLAAFPGQTVTNRRFREFDLHRWDVFWLPTALTGLLDAAPAEVARFVEDDNRGAILPDPVATLDGTEFFLSIKGVGSTIDPYSWRALDRAYAAELSDLPAVQDRLRRAPADASDRIISGEVWLRGSPYGGQGIDHARTALHVSERADLTSLGGFRIAPVVKICYFPEALEEQLRSIHWYRKYEGRFVQEVRLVPSNVRVYFHGKTTVGHDIRHLFDLFAIGSDAAAVRFEVAFVRSTVAMLTLFARTMEREANGTRFRGLDFDDVWLDKDAVLAPDGTAFFVDLEGLVERTLERSEVGEKIEDQVHRSLYELTYAYEQIEAERERRFGARRNRKAHFSDVLRTALAFDPFVRLLPEGNGLDLEIRNNCDEEPLYVKFRAVDG